MNAHSSPRPLTQIIRAIEATVPGDYINRREILAHFSALEKRALNKMPYVQERCWTDLRETLSSCLEEGDISPWLQMALAIYTGKEDFRGHLPALPLAEKTQSLVL